MRNVEFAEFSDAVLDLSKVTDVILSLNEDETISRPVAAFDGITVRGFGAGDTLEFADVNFDERSLTVTYGSAILEIDVDLDGETDATITLLGDFEGGEFTVDIVGANTEITVEFPPELTFVEGTPDRDNLIGTEGRDEISSLAGSYDKMMGGAEADQFVFGAEALNGVRERDVILDYEVGIDEIVLRDGAAVGSIRETSTQVVIFLEGDRDAIYVRGDGVTADNIAIVTEDAFAFV